MAQAFFKKNGDDRQQVWSNSGTNRHMLISTAVAESELEPAYQLVHILKEEDF